ncbi:MAG: proton-conducting transporter membrane subunit [Candidatus Omnitrophota bacterium]|jgi:formate hydrogenlyase subunit 3/multisubunit Na+/H+ antiporter MnhD subunit
MIPDLLNLFKLDYLNSFVILSISIFSILVVIYSLKFMQGKVRLWEYYFWIILTSLASIGAALANNLILLLVFWGFLGLTLYMLINMGGKDSDKVAKKTFIIIGGSDCLMLLGIGIIYHLTGTFQMDKIHLAVGSSGLTILAFLCLAIACFAKAGAMPFHTWVPDCAESAPVPVAAFLPAALDKLLGIYLLARICLNLFIMNRAMNILLMLIGAFTIIAAVMMALVQHNLKRLLGYHAVSQVGYMVLGIGTGIPIGIAGGIFHMLNNTIYKSCLFLTGGNVESKTQTAELDKLGGLSKIMPLTYTSCLIASLAISGVPPLNGFVSKWMVYQGLISQLRVMSPGLRITSILCLAAAMIGSALTLASFMKLIHATFLGQAHKSPNIRHNEVSWTMWLPCLILAVICIIFGIFAYQVPLRYLIWPILADKTFIGFWSPGLATILIIIGLILGLIIFKLSKLKLSFRQDSPFVGGETTVLDEGRVSGIEFYNTVKEIGPLARMYKLAEAKFFDIYDLGQKGVFRVTNLLRYLHNGVLPTYLVWCLLGMMVMFFVLR